MPRPKSYQSKDLVIRAMKHFWAHGFYASSIDALVAATGVSRHGLYAEFGDKRGLFTAAMEAYFDVVVTPAFQVVEAEGAGFAGIRAYFEIQIGLAEKAGLPGPGCLVANTMVESGPHDSAFRGLIDRHLARLNAGFRHALQSERRAHAPRRPLDVEALAELLTVSAQGLWSFSRVTPDAWRLRAYVDQLIAPIEEKFA